MAVEVLAKTQLEAGLTVEEIAEVFKNLAEVNNDDTVLILDNDKSYVVREISTDGTFIRLHADFNNPAVHPDC